MFGLPRKERAAYFSRERCEEVAHLLESSRMEDGRYDGNGFLMGVIIDPAEVRKYLLGKKVKYLVILEGGDKRIRGLFIVEGECAWDVQVSDFYVCKDYRNKGYGTKMMRSFLARLKKGGAGRYVGLRLTVKNGNKGAERFYRRFGFVDVAKEMRMEVFG